MAACSSVRHVPKGEYLLDKVSIHVENGLTEVNAEELTPYVRQQPNHKFLWTAKLQLGIYNMSGADTTHWYNRWIRSLGEAPVIYDAAQTDASVQALQRALHNKGFLGAHVEADTFSKPDSRKMRVDYRVNPGRPHRITSISYDIADDSIADIVNSRTSHSLIAAGDPLDLTMLDAERDRLTSDLRHRGYYAFGKDMVTFSADTTAGSLDADLTVHVCAHRQDASPLLPADVKYRLRKVVVVMNYDPARMSSTAAYAATDTTITDGLLLLSDGKPYLRPSVVEENVRLRPGDLYNSRQVERTYQTLSRLEILNFAAVRTVPVADSPGELDAFVLLTPGKPQNITLELEGTNSEGDLGVAAALGYAHTNIGRGSETFSTRLRTAYESLSGNLDGLIHDRYLELSLESSLNFPRFKAPFLSTAFKRSIMASTKLHLALTYQERPEYTRVIGAASWSYIWNRRNGRLRHTFAPLDVNYVYLPEHTIGFLDQIAPDNPLLRYSYEDHFIMSMGYRFYATSKRSSTTLPVRRTQNQIWTLRAGAEIAGNLLYAINSIFSHRRDLEQDPYEVFGIRYAQYVKAEADYAFTHIFDHRSSLAFHAGTGVIVPYGNSRMAPFEKRFYGGGANGVRGWDVRTLGPGSYDATNSMSSFINQCGDIRLDLSLEYRARLFWVVELGVFVDAGNIWTIHDYASQPGGMFHFSTFYKQLAAAYGVGLRLDFDYFLLRLDLGMKAHNPAAGQQPWPLIHPRWGRDSSLHFSIGYPF